MMNWNRLAVIGLSLCAGVALCYPGQLMDELPPVYVDRLKTLKFALALNDNWSPVWSETLTREAVAEHPDARFCEQLVPDDEAHSAAASATGEETAGEETTTVTETYDPFGLIAVIVDKCWYSGLFVKYAIRVLGHATNCLFYRHALLHLGAVEKLLAKKAGQELNDFLQRLIVDYRAVADKLAVVGAPLHGLLQVATYMDDVEKLTAVLRGKDAKRAHELKTVITQVSVQLQMELNSYRATYCAANGHEWFDVDTGELETLTLDGDSDPAPQAADGGAVLARAEHLRSLMRRVFDGLYATGVSPAVWKEIFHSNIFVKSTDLLTVGNTANVKSGLPRHG